MGIPKLDTVSDYLTLYNENHQQREAFVFVHTDGSRTAISFGQLFENSLRLAKSFLALGVKKSEVVAIALRNCPEWLYAALGAIMAGARPIGLSFTYTDGSDVIAIMKKLQNCSAIVLDPVADEETWKIFQKLVKEYDTNGHVQSDHMTYLRYLICRQKVSDQTIVLTMDDMMKWKPMNTTLPEIKADDILTLFQTSGSTGGPKIVAHSNRSLIASVMIATSSYPVGVFFSTYNDRPFNWMGGFPLNVLTGDTRVTRNGYCEDPKDLAEFTMSVVKSENCIVLGTLPPLVKTLLERKNKVKSDWRVPCIACGGQPLSATFCSSIVDLCQTLVSSYGATECFVTSMLILDPKTFKDNCIGKPYKDIQMKICNEGGQIVPTNERGEIYVKSEGMFQGYYNDPEKTKAVFTEDGWYKTDDIGYVTEEGLFFCEGRKSDTIISGDMNVVPIILEAAIKKCPGVESVVCVPVAHEVMFQVVCACVIRNDGSDLTEDQLRQYCEEVHNDKSRLFTVLPTHYLFLTEFPETYTGKLSRKKLTEMAADRFKSA